MRLSLIPALSSDLVAALEVGGFRTDADILFAGSPIDILQRLPPGVVSLADLKACIALVAEKTSAHGLRGDEFYDEQLQRQRDYDTDITCGVDELDALANGFGNGRVFEISGDRGSGKTSLVLQIALRLLAGNKEASVLWMDTTGDFSAPRTSQVARKLLVTEVTTSLFHSLGQIEYLKASTVLERLQVSLVLDIETASNLLEDLESLMTANTLPGPGVRLVIIDSITPLLAPSLSAVSSHGHATMAAFMRHLRTIARSYYLAFLVVNNTSASHPHNPTSVPPSTARKPALGPSFTFLTDCTIWLARHEDPAVAEAGSSIHMAEIFKSRSTSNSRLAITNAVLIQNPKRHLTIGDVTMTHERARRCSPIDFSALRNNVRAIAGRVFLVVFPELFGLTMPPSPPKSF